MTWECKSNNPSRLHIDIGWSALSQQQKTNLNTCGELNGACHKDVSEPVSGWKMGLADVKPWISERDNSPTMTTQAMTGVIKLGAPGGQKSGGWGGVRSSSGTVGGGVALSPSWFRDSRR